MSKRYESPLAFKAALEQRLKNHARTTGGDMSRLRQLLVMDRFLARVFAAFIDAAVLKGGLVLELRLARARSTKDIDLRLMGDPDTLLERLQEAGRLDLGDYLTFEVSLDANHPVIEAEGMRYEGRRFRVQGRLAAQLYGWIFGVDVALAEPMVGQPETITGSALLEFVGITPPSFRAYPVATHIAEKLHAYTLPRTRPNTRIKDLLDLALLASIGALDATVLREAITKTFAHRATHPVPASFPPPQDAWRPGYAKIARENRLAWPELEEVTGVVRTFLDPVLRGEGGQWEPTSWRWM